MECKAIRRLVVTEGGPVLVVRIAKGHTREASIQDSRLATYIHWQGDLGVNWLTILGDRWVQEIGGLDYLRVRLGEDFKLTPYEGGLMIQAGPRPQIGDAAANLWPSHYVTLAKVLKPIQIKDHYPFHFGDSLGPARMDHQASKAWIFRFDGK